MLSYPQEAMVNSPISSNSPIGSNANYASYMFRVNRLNRIYWNSWGQESTIEHDQTLYILRSE